jgi:peptide/nickel transport system substrate-binding protein
MHVRSAWRRRGPALGLVAAVLVAAAGCGGSAAPATQVGKPASSTGSSTTYSPAQTLVVAGDITDAVTLDPGSAYEFSSGTAVRLTYATLATFPVGNMSQPAPYLAQSWSVSSDGKTWTFHLKPNMKFSNGDPVTADDVVYSFERVVNLKNDPASWLVTQMGFTPQNFSQYIKAVDPTTVTITLPKPFSPGAFLAIMTNGVTSVVDQKVVEQHVQGNDWGAAWLYNHSAGAGPYELVNWTKDVKMEFVANPNYTAGTAPSIKHIIFNSVTDNTTQLDELQRGTADIALDLSADQIASLANDSNVKVFKAPEESMTYVGMDVGNVPALANPQVREAVKYAIDYSSIIKNLLAGNGVELQDIIPNGIFGYVSQNPFTYDPAKAKAMMAAAGFPNGFSATLTIPNGTVSGGVDGTSLGDALQSEMAQAGIRITLQQLTSSELFSEYRAHKLQMVLATWGMDYPDPQDFAAPFGDYTQKSLIWRLQDNDQQMAKVVEQAATMQNTPQRAALYLQLFDMEKTGPFALIYQPDTVLAYSAKLGNFAWDPSNGTAYWQITKTQ